MIPTPRVAPKKIGAQGPSMKMKASSPQSSSSTSFTAEERAELRKLSALLPSGQKSSDPSQVVVHAASYIQKLVATVYARVNNGTLPKEALNSLPPAFNVTSTIRRNKRRSVEKRRR